MCQPLPDFAIFVHVAVRNLNVFCWSFCHERTRNNVSFYNGERYIVSKII